jgi:type I restriction enzyme S subunit
VSDDGRSWFGNLPTGWSDAPIGYHFEVTLGKMINARNAVSGGISAPYLAAGSIQPEHLVLDESKRMQFSKGELRNYALKRDDIVVVEGGAGYGRSHLLKNDLVGWGFQNHVARLRKRSGSVLPGFLVYCLKACLASGHIEANNRTATLPSLSRDVLGAIIAPVPPLEEQCAIADYLDHETTQIDALVAKQAEFITLLRERRVALTDEEFQQPEGKRRATVRQAVVRLHRPPLPGSGVVTAYRDGIVTLRANRRAEGYTMSEAEAGYQGVIPGDIVFHALDGFAGAVGISDSSGQCSPVYHVCRPRHNDDAEYLALLIRYMGTSGFLSTQAPSTRQRSVDFRNWATFARVPLMLPAVEHQKAFVAAFREHEDRVDALIAKAEEHIALAKERRSALITAAVTGQIDVRTARKAS